MNDTNELRAALRQYYGDGNPPFHHSLNRKFFYTRGVQFFAKNAGGGSYWLLDILAFEKATAAHLRENGFAVAKLVVDNEVAMLTVTDEGNLVFSQHIPYTDCPTGEWKFFLMQTVVGSTEGVMILLPSEN